MLTSRHLIAPHRVLLVSICWYPAVFACMGTHSVCLTVTCKITVDSTTTSSAPITVVFCTASSSTEIILLVTVVSFSSIVLTASVVLTFTLRLCKILHLHYLHHFLHFLQLCDQLFLGILCCVGHMIYQRWHNCWGICLGLLLLQIFLYPCDDIAHHVGMMHTGVFNGEVRRLSHLSVSCPKKKFE